MKNSDHDNPGFVLVGDSVCLYSEILHGFLYSCQSSCAHTEVVIGVDQDVVSPNIPNIHGAVFQICVQNRYKFNKQLPKIGKKLEADGDSPHLQVEFQQTKAAADAENQDNDTEQTRQTGKRLLYGQIIQLRHWYTTKYIHVNTTKTSWTEASNMLVELRPENGKTALFRIMPRYKVKAEGEAVQFQDQIVFESVKSPGQFLHCSQDPLGRLVYEESHELNLSVKPSGFTVFKHFRPLKELRIRKTDSASGFTFVEEKVTGGSFLRLYHRELEAYLVAEGVAELNIKNNVYGSAYSNGRFLTEIVNTALMHVHLRVRQMDPSVPRTMYPSSSAITYWQIEKEQSSIDGSIVHWEEQCRLKHVTTRLYLLVQQDGQVELTNDGQDPRTVFRLHPVTKDNEAVLFDSFVRVENVVTGFWLHGDPSKTYEPRRLSVDHLSMQSLAWSTAGLKEVSTSSLMQYNDAFSLQKVDEQLVNSANYVAGAVPFMHKLVYDNNHGKTLSARRIASTALAFDEMKQFVFIQGFPDKKRQKLLRNFMVVDILVELLKCSTEATDQTSALGPIFSLCYRVLYNYLRGDSRKNELYLARHLDFFMTQLSIPGDIGLNTALMVMELIRDNRRMIDRLTTTEIYEFCQLLQKNRNYRFLDLLSVLCICNGIALHDNQNFIVEEFLVKSANEGLNCVYFTEVGHNLANLGLKPNVVYISTDGRATWKPLSEFAQKVADKETYLFLEYQLKLFSNLCYGRNSTALEAITQTLNYLTWEEAFLCISDSNIPDQLRAVYCGLILDLFIEVGSNSSVLDRVNLVFIYPDIPLPGQRAIEHDGTIYEECVPLPFVNELKRWLWQFLDSNHSMIESMLSRTRLIEKVLGLLFSLVQFGYYGDTDDIKKLLHPLLSLLDGTNDQPFYMDGDSNSEIDRLLTNYRNNQRFERNINSAAIMAAKYQALKVIDLFFNYRFNTRLERFLAEFKYTLMMENSAEGQAELSPFLHSGPDYESNPALNHRVIKRLSELFSETGYFAGNFIDILMDLCNYKSDDLVTAALALIYRYHSAYENLFQRAIQTQVLITEKSSVALRSVGDFIPQLKLMSRTAKMNEATVEQIKGILEEFIGMCHLPEDKYLNHAMNQKILYNHGIFSDIFDILSRRFDPALVDRYSGAQDVFRACFEFLRFFARNNPIVQRRLFDRLNVLLKVDYALDELAYLFLEIFVGNKSLCLKILPQHINTLVFLLSNTGNATMIRVISALIMVGNLPLKRNQTLVVKALLKYSASIDCVLNSTAQERTKIMNSDESDERALNEKRYFCNIIQLLGFCAWGDNRTVESICQCMFDVDELLDYIGSKQLCGGIRKAFVQFLLAVFLMSDCEAASTDLKGISTNPKFWNYVNLLISELEQATQFATEQETTARSLLKQKPTHLHVSREDSIHETKELLHYLFDAAFPLMVHFLKNYYTPEKSHQTLGGQLEYLNRLQLTLITFAQAIHPCLSIADHLKTLVTVYTQITAKVMSSHVRGLPEILSRGLLSMGGIKEKYEQYYSTETQINEQLNAFVRNIKAAYGGANTVRQQLGLPIDRHYAEIRDDTEEEYDLPLGMEFQKLIRRFLDKDAKKPVDKYRRASKLLQQLENSRKTIISRERDKMEQNRMDLKCLQVLRALVHNEVVQLPHKRSLNKPLYDAQILQIRAVQQALVKLDALPIVLPHISQSDNELSLEVVAFITALLFDGNEIVQNSMMKYFLSTKEETFFHTVKMKMQLSANAMKERRALIAQHKNILMENQAHFRAIMKQRTGSRMSNRSGLTHKSSEDHNALLKAPGLRDLQSRVSSALNWRRVSVGPMLQVPKISVQMDGEEATELREVLPGSAKVDFNETIDDLLQFKDTGHFELILRMLALMCDGQNKGTQDYLREQKDNIKSFNLVAEAAAFLQLLYSNIDLENIVLINQLFETLTEFAQGNPANQMVIFDQKIVDYVNFILRRDTYGGCEIEEIWRLKLSIGFIIVSLTEENMLGGHAKTIMECVGKDNIHKIMVDAHSLVAQSHNGLETEQRVIIENVGLVYCQILQRSFDLEPYLNKHKEQYTDCPAWTFFSSKILSVEIVKDDNLQRVYFPARNKHVISTWIKDKLVWEIDRSSPSVKLQELMKWGQDIRSSLHFQRKIDSVFFLRWLVRGWLPLNLIVLLLSFVINAGIMAFWVAPERHDPNYNYSVAEGRWQPEYNDTIRYCILLLGICHNLLSVLLFLSYLLANKPKLPAYLQKNKNIPMRFANAHQHTPKLKVNLFGFKTLYYVLFMLLSFLGTFVSSAIFSIHLLHIAANNQLLSRVIRAITRNGKSLLWVAFMGLIMFYIYALVGFSFLRDVFNDNNLFCTSMWECFLTMIREGLLYGLTERFDISTSSPNFNFKFYAYKLLFDVSFFVIITTIGLNIIFGIIVDTFSELRDNKWYIENDMKTTCFICSKNSFEFERYAKGFIHHIYEEHNMWSYLLFFIHLDETPKNYLSALELYVFRLMHEERCDFFPLGRAMALMNSEANDTDTRLELLVDQVNMLVARIEQEDKLKVKELERKRQEEWEEEHGILHRRKTNAKAILGMRPAFVAKRGGTENDLGDLARRTE